MFKLFKELTKSARRSASTRLLIRTFTGMKALNRIQLGAGRPSLMERRSRSRAHPCTNGERAKREDEVETDEYARRRTELLKQLEGGLKTELTPSCNASRYVDPSHPRHTDLPDTS